MCRLPIDADKLACFKKMTASLEAPKDPVNWNAVTQTELDEALDIHRHHAAEKKEAKRRVAANDWHIRSTTDIGKKNDEAAKLALTRTNGQNTGMAKIAVLYVRKAGIADFLSDTQSDSEKTYLGIGLHRDDSKPTQLISSSNVRFGYRKVFQGRAEDAEGAARAGWLSIARQNDHIAAKATLQLDAGYEYSKRWYLADKYDRVAHDRLLRVQLNPFSDRTLKSAAAKTSTSGMGLTVEAEIYQPTHVGWLEKSKNSLLPGHLNISSTRLVGSSGARSYSTMNKWELTWVLAKSPIALSQTSISLAREVGSNFREGIANDAKTSLTLDYKFN
jgi:hypothetical protein